MSKATELRKAYKDKEALIYEQCQMYKQRCDFLEQLCNDLFNYVCAETIGIYITREQFVELSERMCDLGLMEEFYEQNNGNS